MTTRQKMLFGMAIIAAVGMAGYEGHQTSVLRTELDTLRKQEGPLRRQVEQLNHERDEAIRLLAPLRAANERFTRSNSELPRLRGEVSRLRREGLESAHLKSTVDAMTEPARQWSNRAEQWRYIAEQRPKLRIPEFQFLTDEDWLRAGDPGSAMKTDEDVRRGMAFLRASAKSHFFPKVAVALTTYIATHDGELPNEILQLKPYLGETVDEAMLQRYELLHTGRFSDYPESEPLLVERAAVDDEYDMLVSATAFSGSSRGIGKLAGNGGSWTMPTNVITRLRSFAR